MLRLTLSSATAGPSGFLAARNGQSPQVQVHVRSSVAEDDVAGLALGRGMTLDTVASR